MSLSVTAFTRRGVQLALNIAEKLENAQVWTLPKHAEEGCLTYDSLSAWTEEQFRVGNDLIFVSAAGIAVRSIAPFLRDKLHDPAVVSVDEMGRFVVPLVSGHVGGANRLARRLARLLGAQAVISTATDLNDLFSVDQWASDNGILFSDRKAAKRISADLLAGWEIRIRCDVPHSAYPEGIVEGENPDLVVTAQSIESHEGTLVLHPPVFAVGIGCKKGLPPQQVTETVERVFREHGLAAESIFCLASIDLKQEDEGIRQLASKLRIPCRFFTSAQLAAAEGVFTPSSFVRSVTGVDNVCERSAVLASGGSLIVKKTACSGVTVAVAQRAFYADFERKRDGQ